MYGCWREALQLFSAPYGFLVVLLTCFRRALVVRCAPFRLLCGCPVAHPVARVCRLIAAGCSAVRASNLQFTVCLRLQALNNASRKDKTNSLLDRTHRLHQDHASIIVAKVQYRSFVGVPCGSCAETSLPF